MYNGNGHYVKVEIVGRFAGAIESKGREGFDSVYIEVDAGHEAESFLRTLRVGPRFGRGAQDAKEQVGRIYAIKPTGSKEPARGVLCKATGYMLPIDKPVWSDKKGAIVHVNDQPLLMIESLDEIKQPAAAANK